VDGADALLAAFDEQRARMPHVVPDGVVAEQDGPLLRTTGWARGGFVEYRDLGGLEGPELDALIARQVRFFAGRGEHFEWKLHGHDLPRGLPWRLRAAGFVPDPEESVLVAEVAEIAREATPPRDVSLRETTSAEDIARIAGLQERIWGGDCSWLVEMLGERLALDPDSLCIAIAEAGGECVAAGWLRLERETPFARLNGGSTLKQWRGRGIYRALVAHRAMTATARGYRYLTVDASAESRPILERLGFVAITSTTPYIWTPPE